MSNDTPQTPELDKQLAIVKSGKADLIQEFIDWLLDPPNVNPVHPGKGFDLCRWHDKDGRYYPDFASREQIMADFFGIDRNKIEQERRELLDYVRRNDGPIC